MDERAHSGGEAMTLRLAGVVQSRRTLHVKAILVELEKLLVRRPGGSGNPELQRLWQRVTAMLPATERRKHGS
jgi:hypothetical protein